MSTPEPPHLQYPTDYPIKVVGRAGENVRAQADAILAAHVPDLDPARTTERLSANGNFVAVSYLIRAVSEAQVTALATDLKACRAFLMVI